MDDDGHVKIQVLSDIHLEFFEVKRVQDLPAPLNELTVAAPLLALVGDIGNPFSKLYKQFLQEMSAKFEFVLLLTGNHEYYFGEMTEVDEALRKLTEKMPNVKFLQRQKFEYKGVVFLGATLWTNIPSSPRSIRYYWTRINDYRRIQIIDSVSREKRLLEPYDVISFHERDKSWIESEISSSEKIICILTHHAPIGSHSQTPAMRKGGKDYSLTYLDFTDLTHLMGNKVKVWCFGHTHHSSSQVVNGTKVVSNCLGYKFHKPDPGFSPNFTVDTSSVVDTEFSSRGHYTVEI